MSSVASIGNNKLLCAIVKNTILYPANQWHIQWYLDFKRTPCGCYCRNRLETTAHWWKGQQTWAAHL